MSDSSRHSSTPVRVLLWSCGVLALLLGLLGVLLPGLPTTPFVLLSAGCFVRASPRTHAWLLNSRWFGPVLRDWEQHRSIPRRAKYIAFAMMVTSVAGSLWFFAGQIWIQAAIATAAVTGAMVIARIPSR
jgi:uncharacterized membrane protein YbaN (DUF454 family)